MQEQSSIHINKFPLNKSDVQELNRIEHIPNNLFVMAKQEQDRLYDEEISTIVKTHSPNWDFFLDYLQDPNFVVSRETIGHLLNDYFYSDAGIDYLADLLSTVYPLLKQDREIAKKVVCEIMSDRNICKIIGNTVIAELAQFHSMWHSKSTK